MSSPLEFAVMVASLDETWANIIICIPSAFRKEVIFAIDVDHAILQHALPLVFDALYLEDKNGYC
jgi:hypothetical protein